MKNFNIEKIELEMLEEKIRNEINSSVELALWKIGVCSMIS